MTKCLKRDAKIIHTPEFINAFDHCASNFAIGAVLSQEPIPIDKPIAYASRTLNDTETKYSTIEKELIKLNLYDNESVVNNPGDTDANIKEYLENQTEISAQGNDDDTNEPGPSQRKINVISDIRLHPVNLPNTCNSDETAHSQQADRENPGLSIRDEMINKKILQFLIKKSLHLQIKCNKERFDKTTISHVELPNNLEIIKQFIQEYMTNEKPCYVYFIDKDLIPSFTEAQKINIHFSTPKHYESNSPVERFHSTLIEHLRILKQKDNVKPINELISYAIIAYNSTVHSVTKFTPHEIVLGHTNSRDPLDLIATTFHSDYVSSHKNKVDAMYETIGEKTDQNKEKILARRNVKGNEAFDFKLNQKVYKNLNLRNKNHPRFSDPYVIIEKLNHNKVKIKSVKSPFKIEIVHVKELKKPLITDDPSYTKNPDTMT
ncbi:uncharacterized protein [Euwallacea similis]|uniref:uncharacterized protein n=1 Tax=Euwallacea similis TaxID=1736056 RepID=UPI00344BC0AA